MKDSKVKVPLIITGVNVLAYLAPFIILLPLLMIDSTILQKSDADVIGFIGVILFIILFIIDLILIFLSPFMQIGLIIVAIKNRNWRLLGIHIPLAILFSGGGYVIFEWFTNLSV